jgi:hypothetical protein
MLFSFRNLWKFSDNNLIMANINSHQSSTSKW